MLQEKELFIKLDRTLPTCGDPEAAAPRDRSLLLAAVAKMASHAMFRILRVGD